MFAFAVGIAMLIFVGPALILEFLREPADKIWYSVADKAV